MYVLSADFGTSSVKLALVDRSLRLCGMAKRSYRYTILDDVRVEISMDELTSAFLDALGEFADDLHRIEAIAIDTFAPSLVLMDEGGEALHPIITHLDRRSRRQAEQIAEVFGVEAFLKVTGTLPHAGGVTLTTLKWLFEEQPELMARTYQIGHLSTYLYRFMTGRWAIDEVNACVTGMYSTVTGGGWSRDICDTFGIPMGILPPVRRADREYAPLTEGAACRMGLKSGIPVLLGTQDVAAAHIGAGNVKSGDVLMISGSSEMISVLTDNPVTDRKYYLRKSASPGLWQVFSITTGGFALDWFQREFCRELSAARFFEEYIPQVLDESREANSVQFCPYLSGDRQSMRFKTGGFSGLTLSTSREDMLYSVLEGIQLQTRETLARCEKHISINSPMKATGNLAETESYLRLKRRIFRGMDIELADNCPLKGNALLAHTLLDSVKKGGNT